MDITVSTQSLLNSLLSSPNVIHWLDLDGNFLGCNAACSEIFKLKSPQCIVGKSYKDFFSSKYVASVVAENKKIIQSKKAKISDEVLVFADGHEIRLMSRKSPLFNADKEVVGVLVSSESVVLQSSHSRIDKTLAEVLPEVSSVSSENMSFSEYVGAMLEYYENILAQVPGHIYWENLDGVILGCNNLQAEDAGVSDRKDVIGKTIFDFLPRKLALKHRDNNKKVIRTEKPLMFEEVSASPDGKVRVYLSQKTPIKDRYGKIVGVLGASVDISERKALEHDLIAAKQQAEVANELKTEFVLNMEHDLRTPAAGLNGLTAVLAKSEKDAKRKHMLSLVHNASSELLNMFEDIIQFKEVDKDRFPVLNKKFNLKEVVDGVVNLELVAAKDKKLKLVVNYDSEMPKEIISDKFRVQKILLNLIGNAIKFTDNGKITVAANLLKMDQKKKEILIGIQVSDTGIGIPVDKHEVIFEKFVRLDPSNKNKYKGIGMGLYLVKQFVEDMVGEITLSSIVGQGSVFTCKLSCKFPS